MQGLDLYTLTQRLRCTPDARAQYRWFIARFTGLLLLGSVTLALLLHPATPEPTVPRAACVAGR